jgi:hypothetical protein
LAAFAVLNLVSLMRCAEKEVPSPHHANAVVVFKKEISLSWPYGETSPRRAVYGTSSR